MAGNLTCRQGRAPHLLQAHRLQQRTAVHTRVVLMRDSGPPSPSAACAHSLESQDPHLSWQKLLQNLHNVSLALMVKLALEAPTKKKMSAFTRKLRAGAQVKTRAWCSCQAAAAC